MPKHFCNSCKCFQLRLPPDMTSYSGREVKGASAGFGYCTHLSEYCHYFNACSGWRPSIHQQFGINDNEIEENREAIYDSIVLRRILKHIKRLQYESNGNRKMMETFIPEISSWKQNFQTELENPNNIHRTDVINSISYWALVTRRGEW